MNRLDITVPHRVRTILCPVSMRHDGISQAALVAYALAKQYRARLVLLHVSSPDAVIGYQRMTIARKQLRELASRFSSVRTIAMTVGGDVPSAISRETADCDLLVMRPSRAWWLVGRLVDSLSQRVCRMARCPVMLISPGNYGREHNRCELDLAAAVAARDFPGCKQNVEGRFCDADEPVCCGI